MPDPQQIFSRSEIDAARLELRELGVLVRGAAEVMTPLQRRVSLRLWGRLEAVLAKIISAADRRS